VTYLFTETSAGRRHVLRMVEDDTALAVPEKERFSNLGINYTLVQVNNTVDGCLTVQIRFIIMVQVVFYFGVGFLDLPES